MRSLENIDLVRDVVGRGPNKSLRRQNQELGISRESISAKNLIHNVKLYSYRIQIKHKLNAAHMQKGVTICQWFTDKFEEKVNFLDNVWFSDEAHFNSKNSVYWGSTCLPPSSRY